MPIYQCFYLGGTILTILGLISGTIGYVIKDNHMAKKHTKSQTELNEINTNSRISVETLATNPDAAIDREIEIRTENLQKEYKKGNETGGENFKVLAEQVRNTSEADAALQKAKEQKVPESIQAVKLMAEPVVSILYAEIEKQVDELVKIGAAKSLIEKPWKPFEARFLRVQNKDFTVGGANKPMSGGNFSTSHGEITVISWKYSFGSRRFPIHAAIVSSDGTVFSGKIGRRIEFDNESILGMSSETLKAKEGQARIIEAIQKEVREFLEAGLKESENSKARGESPKW